jgi:hypothetical protein
LRAYCSGNCRVALFVDLHFYNIVVLETFPTPMAKKGVSCSTLGLGRMI